MIKPDATPWGIEGEGSVSVVCDLASAVEWDTLLTRGEGVRGGDWVTNGSCEPQKAIEMKLRSTFDDLPGRTALLCLADNLVTARTQPTRDIARPSLR